MRILSLNPGHDGAAAFIDDGHLVFSLEGEKDSGPRHGALTAHRLIEALEMAGDQPDVIAIGGWHRHLPGHRSEVAAGYIGLAPGTTRKGNFAGRTVTYFTSSHERSHLHMAAAMGPMAPYDDCAILVWEGTLGALYRWRESGKRLDCLPVLSEPGARYSALFALADPGFPEAGGFPRTEAAGKVMALAAYAKGEEPTPDERAVVSRILSLPSMYPFDKAAFRGTPLHNCGVHTAAMHRAAAWLGESLFRRFAESAERWLPRELPFLIAGGCGLNCDWNRRWLDSGLFSSVFIAPCADDSGSAIGTAVDAASHLGAPCRLAWDAYSGLPFRNDLPPGPRWKKQPLSERMLARRISTGDVVAWVEGRCEIGPRALGHRSLLASPLDISSRHRLNAIKQREGYRPIAPCCLAEELSSWFEPPIDDPYMLFFSDVKTDRLPAITHADGTARVQSVGPGGPQGLRRLLEGAREATGVGVLCNTSLNFPGLGFLNTASELFSFAEQMRVDHVVLDGAWYSLDMNAG